MSTRFLKKLSHTHCWEPVITPSIITGFKVLTALRSSQPFETRTHTRTQGCSSVLLTLYLPYHPETRLDLRVTKRNSYNTENNYGDKLLVKHLSKVKWNSVAICCLNGLNMTFTNFKWSFKVRQTYNARFYKVHLQTSSLLVVWLLSMFYWKSDLCLKLI